MKNESRFNYTIELSDKTNDSKHENTITKNKKNYKNIKKRR